MADVGQSVASDMERLTRHHKPGKNSRKKCGRWNPYLHKIISYSSTWFFAPKRKTLPSLKPTVYSL